MIDIPDDARIVDPAHRRRNAGQIGQVIAATPDKPYLSLTLDLDSLKISELMQKMPPAHLSAGTARGLGVGYESPSQFNREYRHLFGAPPHRDMTQIREVG